MKFIKNVIFVSYLKNKGIRRICFVLGAIPYLAYVLLGWIPQIKDNFFCEEYSRFADFKNKNKYNENKKKIVFKKYPAEMGIKNLDNYNGWEAFFFDEYGESYEIKNFYKRTCIALLLQDENAAKKVILEIYTPNELPKALDKVKNICPQMHEYIKQPIKIARYNFLYILNLAFFLFLIYPPFIMCCIIKWIYKGFREN